MKNILVQLKGILELEFEQDVEDFYHDWNYSNNTGMITAVFENDIFQSSDVQFSEFKRLIKEVERISTLVEKRPEKTEAFQISPKIYLVKRDGILVQIEKALIQKGYEQILMVTKDTLEKSFFHRDGQFKELIKQPVADIFIDWYLKEDNSMLCLVLK